MILQDIFHYFAKYPSQQAVNKFFNRKNASSLDSYAQMKAKALTACKEIYPEITDYIYGVNEDQVKKQISQVRGIYLFIDYGNITSRVDRLNVKEDVMQLAVTIAKPISSGTFDMAEEILITEQLLQIMTSIRDDMRNDRSDPFIKRLTFPYDITPFFARELSNSYGWTLMFNISGIDMV